MALYMRRGFAAILLVGLVATLAILGTTIYLKRNNLLPTFNKSVNQPALQSSPVPQYQTDETVYTDEGNAKWKTYTNREIGIVFQYPPEWGDLKIHEEECLLEKQGSTRVYQNKPCFGITLWAAVSGNPAFLVVQSKLFSQYIPGRGASWGDMFPLATNYSGITPEKYVKNYCDNPQNLYSCSIQTNPNGVLYKKSLEEEFALESARKALYYAILNTNENFPVILISNQEFLDTMSLKDTEKIFDQILSTFKFVE